MDPRDTEDSEQRYSPQFWEALGRTIKVLRTDLGIGRRELAERARISYSYLTEIENGNKPPSSSVVMEIAEALGMRASRLIEAAEARAESPWRVNPQGGMTASAETYAEATAEAGMGPSARDQIEDPTQAWSQAPGMSAEGWLRRFGPAAQAQTGSPRGVIPRGQRAPAPWRDGEPPVSDSLRTVLPSGRVKIPADDESARGAGSEPGCEPGREPGRKSSRELGRESGLESDRQVGSRPLPRDDQTPPQDRPMTSQELRAVLTEFERLLRHMTAEDAERLLDFARRLLR